MKQLVALAILVTLLGLGWDQSFKSRYDALRGIAPDTASDSSPDEAPAPAPVTTAPSPQVAVRTATPAPIPATPARDRSWMFKSTPGMDKPYKTGGTKQ